MQESQGTAVSRAIAKLEKTANSSASGIDVLSRKTTSYTDGPSLVTMSSAVLSHTETISYTFSSIKCKRTTTLTSESVSKLSPICLLTRRRAAIITLRTNVPTNTEMRLSYGTTTSSPSYLLLRETKGKVSAIIKF